MERDTTPELMPLEVWFDNCIWELENHDEMKGLTKRQLQTFNGGDQGFFSVYLADANPPMHRALITVAENNGLSIWMRPVVYAGNHLRIEFIFKPIPDGEESYIPW